MHKKPGSKLPLIAKLRSVSVKKWFNPLLLVICFLFLLGIRFQTDLPTFGDEPHYLLMNYSLVHDGDLDLTNNYANADYARYYPYGTLKPQNGPNAIDGKLYSIHPAGLTLFLMPGFIMGDKIGAIEQMVLLATATVWLTWIWVRQLTGRRLYAYICGAALTVSYFFANMAGYIYPDMLVGALMLGALIIVTGSHYKRWQFQLLLGALLGFLIITHFKMIAFAFPILAVLMYKLWKDSRTIRAVPWIPTLFVIAATIYGALSFVQWYGIPITQAFGSGQQGFSAEPLTNLTAMLFDAVRGLFVYNPFLLLIFVGLPIWFKQSRESLVITLLATVPSIITVVCFIQWHAGYSPTGRYLIPFIPIYIAAAGFALSKMTALWQKIIIWILGIVSVAITLTAAIRHFPLLDPNLPFPRNRLFIFLHDITGVSFDSVLPRFTTTLSDITLLVSQKMGYLKIFICWIGVFGLLVYGYFLSKDRKQGTIKKKG